LNSHLCRSSVERVVARLEGIEVIVGVDRHLAKEIESKMFAKIAR
jgi:hypothetical protein